MPDLHECMFDCPHSDQIEPLNVETRMAFISFWALFIFITLGNMLQMCIKICCVSPVFFWFVFATNFLMCTKEKASQKGKIYLESSIRRHQILFGGGATENR